jgi:hypothetical protein
VAQIVKAELLRQAVHLFATDLNRPRTIATHGREPISALQAEAAIAVAEKLVEPANPLPQQPGD